MSSNFKKRAFSMAVGAVVATISSAHAQDVELNPVSISGTVQLGSEPLNFVFMNAFSGPFSASQNLPFAPAPSKNYDLTVQVEAGASRTYQVSADIRTGNARNRLFLRNRPVTVTDGIPAILDFIVDPIAFVEGTVTVTGGAIGSATVSANQTAAPFDFAQSSPFATGGPDSIDFRFPVVPDREVRCVGTVRLTNGNQLPLPGITVTPTAANPGVCNYDLVAPQIGSIAGTVDFIGPQNVDSYSISVTGPQFSSTTAEQPFDGPGNKDSYRIDDLQAGTYNFNAVTANFNGNDDRFTFPVSAYDPAMSGIEVTAGATTNVDVAGCQAFLNGTLELTGTASLDDLNLGQVIAEGNQSTSSSTRRGQSFDLITPGTGAYDILVSEGEWALGIFFASLRRPQGDPDGFLNEFFSINNLESRVDFMDFACGETIVRDFTFPTGSFTINFTVAGGGVLSDPLLEGNCQKQDDTTNALLYNYTFRSTSTGQIGVPQGRVTFEGPAGICTNVRARATVAGSLTTFATINGLEIVPGTRIDTDIGAPVVTVTFPEPDLIVDADEITVVGLATDRLGPNTTDPPGDVATLTVDGVAATLLPTNNPDDPAEVSFEVTVPLFFKGPNDIEVVASDSAGNQSTTTLTVFNDAGVPELTFTPEDGALTPLDFSIDGLAVDDAGIELVVIAIDGTEFAVLDGGGDLALPFSVPASLDAGNHTITVVATDISDRSTTVVNRINAADNTPPTANNINVQTDEDTTVEITLDATDPDNDPLTFSILTEPQNGTLSGAAPDLTYRPDQDFFGPDSFDYLANDGTDDSDVAAVAVAVQSVNDPPLADASSDQNLECSSPAGALVAFDGSGSSDVEGDPLSYLWTGSFDPPLTGAMPSTILGLGSSLITLVVNDGQAESAGDTVTVNVVDTTVPDLFASLVHSGNGDDDDDSDEGRFRIDVAADDVCDPEPIVTAVLKIDGCPNIAVTDGQVIEFEFEDEGCEVEWEDGILEIEAPSLVLAVTVVDGSGNSAEVEVLPTGLTADNDDDDQTVAAASLDD